MKIGKLIRELRTEKNLTQSQLAVEIFTSQDTISLWERGKSFPDIHAIIRLAQFFNVSTDYLLGLEQ